MSFYSKILLIASSPPVYNTERTALLPFHQVVNLAVMNSMESTLGHSDVVTDIITFATDGRALHADKEDTCPF